MTPWWDRVEGAGEEPRRSRSVYEDRDGFVIAGGDDNTDPDFIEPGWHRVGTFDRERGAWVGGPPLWPGG